MFLEHPLPIRRPFPPAQHAMLLPGLGLREPEEPQGTERTEYKLKEGSEWRFEVAVDKYIHIKLLTGTAEVFGTEIAIGQSYAFTGTKAAVYTWHGCAFEVSGDVCHSDYIAEETPMIEYANVHFALETLRQESKTLGRQGPRVLILGPENAGKTSLAKILTAYAVRIARQPIVVNLDTREGLMSIPGTLSATAFKTLMDIEEGWGSSPMSGPSGVPVKLPLVYYYGLPHPEEGDGVLYNSISGKIALAVSGRLQDDAEAREAGIIIDTPGSISSNKSGAAYDVLNHIVSEFAVSAIICLGSERLYSDMVKRYDRKLSSSTAATGETISVIMVSKSGGCVDRDEAFMKAYRAAQIRYYFYGNERLSNGIALQPRQTQIDFAALAVYRLIAVGKAQQELSAELFRPGGEDDEAFEPADNGLNLRHNGYSDGPYGRMERPELAMVDCVLALLSADADAPEEEVRGSSVMGFLYVVDVDEARGKINLLAPVAGRIPNQAILWTPWPEEVIGMA